MSTTTSLAIDHSSEQGLSTDEYVATLKKRQDAIFSKGKLLFFQRTEMVMVPVKAHDGYWDCIVVYGNSAYRPDGYLLSVGNEEIEAAIQIAPERLNPILAEIHMSLQ